MSGAALWAALLLGTALGALAMLVWRARREQASAIETELLRARLKTEEALSAEREQALTRAREQLQGVFGELARDSLQSNSEVFLQLARERLARQQSDASQALKERETAIESLVQPIRDALAKTEAQIQAIERDRIDSFATSKPRWKSWPAARICCRAKRAIWSPPCAGPTCAGNGARSRCGGWSNCPA